LARQAGEQVSMIVRRMKPTAAGFVIVMVVESLNTTKSADINK
jgi:hypothetical protein